MEEKHRAHITNNVENLICLTDYDQLMNGCVDRGLLSPQMRKNVECLDPAQYNRLDEEGVKLERHRRLFKKLTMRGPTAYEKLFYLLGHLKFDAAVALLNNTNQNNLNIVPTTSSNTPSKVFRDDDEELIELEEYKGEIRPAELHEVKKSEKLHIYKNVGTYPMKSRDNRGVLLLVNNIKFTIEDDYRNGAAEDSHALLHIFNECNFKLFSYESLSLKQFKNILRSLLKSDTVRHTECFVMALMSHGNSDDEMHDRVQFSDGAVVKVHDIEREFHNDNCPNLVNKPKILMFPFCRGSISDRGMNNNKRVEADSFSGLQPKESINTMPTQSDTLICYAATLGYRAHRDPDKGSWYVQTFCRIMANHAHDTNLVDILEMVGEATQRIRSEEAALQSPNYFNKGFNKKLFFNPGYWEGMAADTNNGNEIVDS